MAGTSNTATAFMTKLLAAIPEGEEPVDSLQFRRGIVAERRAKFRQAYELATIGHTIARLRLDMERAFARQRLLETGEVARMEPSEKEALECLRAAAHHLITTPAPTLTDWNRKKHLASFAAGRNEDERKRLQDRLDTERVELESFSLAHSTAKNTPHTH